MYRFSWLDEKQKRENKFHQQKKNKCFQYTVTAASNHEEMKKYPQGITIIKPFVNKYNREALNFPSEKNGWKNFEKNNVTISLNVLYANKEKLFF